MTRAGEQPHELWHQAAEEHPDNPSKKHARYIELMIDAGHIIDRPLQVNAEPVEVVAVGRCTGCAKRAPWCSCGNADYR